MENWNKISFTELISDRTKDGIKLPTNEYNQSGLTAIIDQGQEFIAGYSDETEGAFTDVPAIIFGDHTRVFKYVDFPFFLGADGVKVLKANQEINYKYLYYFFLQAKFPSTGYARHFKWLKELQIPLPPLEEQKHIAAVLDKCTALIAKHKLMLEKYDTLIKSRFIEMFGDPVQNPMGWKQRQLQDVCNAIVDCPHSTPNYSKENTGFMCIRTNIIRPTGLNWDDIEYISENEFYKRVSRRQPRIGDIVYLREGGILGIAAIINRNVNVALGQRTMLLSPNYEICNSIYVCETMNMKSFFNKALEKMGGSASPHINVADIKAFPISIPPIELQNDFAAFVHQIDKSKFEYIYTGVAA